MKIFFIMMSFFVVTGVIAVGSLFILGSGKNEASNSPEVATIAPEPSMSPTILGATNESTVAFSLEKLYSLINGYRRENKLTPLTQHPLLERSAAGKLFDMKENKYWTHRDPQGREPWYLLEENGYHFEKAGENLSFGYTTEWRVFEEWLKSPEHKAQMDSTEYEHMGLAVDCSSYANGLQDTCIVVLHLGRQLL